MRCEVPYPGEEQVSRQQGSGVEGAAGVLLLLCAW